MSTHNGDFDRLIDALQERIVALEPYTTERQCLESTMPAFQELHTALEELHVADEELRQQHEELAASYERAEFERQRYQELFELAPDGYVVTDKQGIIREANRAAAAMLALSQDRLTGKPLALFVPRDQLQCFYTHLIQLRQDPRRIGWELRLRPWKAAAFAVEVVAAPACDVKGNPVGLRWLFRDITERKRAEQALQEAHDALERRVVERTAYLRQMNEQLLAEIVERRQMERALRENKKLFRAVFDQAAVGIAVLGVDGLWLRVNQRFCNLVGYTAEELYKQSWQQTTHPDDIPAGVKHLRHLLTGEVSTYTQEKRYISKQGMQFWGKSTVSLAYDASGAPEYFINVVEDISTRKLAEEQAQQAKHALHRSREHLRRLAMHLQGTQEKERARIARELHDDLAQILTGLRFDLSWLAKQLATAPTVWRQRVQSMQTQIEDLKKSVHRIATELRPTVLDDLGLFTAIEWQVQQTCRRTGLHYTLHLPDKDDVPLDSEQATTVFRICQEALTNVVRHADASLVTVHVTMQSEALLLEVADNGKGISPEAVLEGNSLGLLGMRERAALWGGEVAVHGTPGKGTTVTVRLPYPAAANGRDV